MRTSSASNRAFSLLELIVVILIIGIIAAYAVPAASTILRGSQVTQASQIVTDQFSLARQQALTRNRMVEVRLIRYADPEVPGEVGADGTPDPSKGAYRAIQVLEIMSTAAAVTGSQLRVPLDKPQLLPQSVVLHPATLSTLIKAAQNKTAPPYRYSKTDLTTNDPELPRNIGRNYDYVSFYFLPDGSTNLNPLGPGGGDKTWNITVTNMNDSPADNPGLATQKLQDRNLNFFTLQVDPVSGTTKAYRPSL